MALKWALIIGHCLKSRRCKFTYRFWYKSMPLWSYLQLLFTYWPSRTRKYLKSGFFMPRLNLFFRNEFFFFISPGFSSMSNHPINLCKSVFTVNINVWYHQFLNIVLCTYNTNLRRSFFHKLKLRLSLLEEIYVYSIEVWNIRGGNPHEKR